KPQTIEMPSHAKWTVLGQSRRVARRDVFASLRAKLEQAIPRLAHVAMSIRRRSKRDAGERPARGPHEDVAGAVEQVVVARLREWRPDSDVVDAARRLERDSRNVDPSAAGGELDSPGKHREQARRGRARFRGVDAETDARNCSRRP